MRPPRSNARASGPQWLRNDVKRSGNRLVAGSFDRFVNSVHRLDRWTCHEGGLGAMTPKIARFLAQRQPATPCLVLDVDRVEDNFRALQRSLPLREFTMP